jgi:precorrin-2 dehydrogenase / sirohydrochlorin ferrochelatase
VSLMVELLPSAGRALVVGGGAVAERKVHGLLEAGFRVRVVALEVLDSIGQPGVEVLKRPFEAGDVAGNAIVFACTNSRKVNRAVGAAARDANVPVVVADSQEESTCFSPAVHRDGDLQVAVSTGGASPVLAREVRDQVAAALGTGWAERVQAARTARQERLAGAAAGEANE